MVYSYFLPRFKSSVVTCLRASPLCTAVVPTCSPRGTILTLNQLNPGCSYAPGWTGTITRIPAVNALVLTYSPRLFHQFVFLFSSNVIDNYTGLPLANGKTTHVTKVGGRTIGFVGLVEDAWIQTLATVDEEQVTYKGTSIFILFPMSVTK